MTAFTALVRDLDQLSAGSRLRTLLPRAGKDFASNDYLGLAQSPELAEAARTALDRGVPVGSGGSRLLRGNHEEHEALESEAADFLGTQSALYFSSGYAANSAVLSTLPQRGDVIIHDELVHASTREGLKLSRADKAPARHNDLGHYEELARAWRQKRSYGRLWFAVESLYSMDGDQAPLLDLSIIAKRFGAFLIIDEAHATGVFGDQGRGLAHSLQDQENVIVIRTCGKALGCEGALVCAPSVVRDFLINRGRQFIFSTAPSPLSAAIVRASLKLLQCEPHRRERLWERIGFAQQTFEALGLQVSGSQIQPIIIGDDAQTMEIAGALQSQGFDVRGIRPPTVPAGTSRLRVSITLNVTEEDIKALSRALVLLPRAEA